MSVECSECEHDLRGGHYPHCSRCPRCPVCAKPMMVEDEEAGYFCLWCTRIRRKNVQQKAYATIPLEKRLSMEAWLHSYLGNDTATQLRQKIHANREGWFAEYHFDWGMHVRNALRRAGFNEQFLGVGNLDDVYVEAIEHAILVNSAGEIMVPVVDDAGQLDQNIFAITPVGPFWTPMKKFVTLVIVLLAAHIIVKLLLKIV